MPFFIQQPPPIEIPRTKIELDHPSIGRNNSSQFNRIKLDRDLTRDIFLKEKFNSLKKAWEKNTIFSSSISKITEDRNFKSIVQMGSNAIPLIIDDIEKTPSNLVWALNIITGRTLIAKYRLTITEACKIWVKLFKQGQIKL
jgi:hypothetical protein